MGQYAVDPALRGVRSKLVEGGAPILGAGHARVHVLGGGPAAGLAVAPELVRLVVAGLIAVLTRAYKAARVTGMATALLQGKGQAGRYTARSLDQPSTRLSRLGLPAC
jgi:hypothetical protein